MVDMPPGENPRLGRFALGGAFLDDSGGMMVAVPAVKSGLLRYTVPLALIG